MTNEQINIAIAETCGYEWRVGIYGNCRGLFHPDDNYLKAQPCLDMLLPICSDCEKKVPNYCDDLNAMHEAENVLEEKRLVWQYEMTLGRNGGNGFIWSKIHATARQRAEAFLKTIGKWE
jgi:hypothetical protein